MTDISILPDRAVIRLAGADRRSFLQGLITQDIDAVTPDTAIFAALLTPQGKILFDFFVAAAGDALLIDCDRESAPALLKRLSLYKLRAKVEMKIDDGLCVIASETIIQEPVLAAFADPRLEGLGWRAIADGASNLMTSPASDLDARRISLGVPAFGQDFGSEQMFLLDVNYDVLNGVSYKKGCFIGQEVTSRMKRKGAARRRTLIVAYDGPAPEKGASVTAGSSTIGEILSGVDGAALALIRLDRWEKTKAAGAAILCGDREMRLSVPATLEQD